MSPGHMTCFVLLTAALYLRYSNGVGRKASSVLRSVLFAITDPPLPTAVRSAGERTQPTEPLPC